MTQNLILPIFIQQVQIEAIDNNDSAKLTFLAETPEKKLVPVSCVGMGSMAIVNMAEKIIEMFKGKKPQ